jgi:predicted HTH transcriptional regulator
MENMDELEKLKKLLHYWMEHNDRDVRIYRDWAEKASSLGNKELSKILIGLSDETKKLDRLFEEAIKMIG